MTNQLFSGIIKFLITVRKEVGFLININQDTLYKWNWMVYSRIIIFFTPCILVNLFSHFISFLFTELLYVFTTSSKLSFFLIFFFLLFFYMDFIVLFFFNFYFYFYVIFILFYIFLSFVNEKQGNMQLKA